MRNDHRTVNVRALSSKAKNRLANTMAGNATCIVEQVCDSKLFLASENRRYFFWMHSVNDPHWEIVP